MMDRLTIEAMLRDLLDSIDYDIAKSYDPKTAEEPEFAEEAFEELVSIVLQYTEH
jgi:hypothetical protein